MTTDDCVNAASPIILGARGVAMQDNGDSTQMTRRDKRGRRVELITPSLFAEKWTLYFIVEQQNNDAVFSEA